MIDLLAGYRRVGAVVNIAAAGNAAAQALILLSVFAQMIGAKSFVIRRLKIRNNNAANTFVHIGTGAAGAVVDAIPALYSIANTTDDYAEGDLPAVNFTGNIMAFVDAVGPGTFDLQVEVEERG